MFKRLIMVLFIIGVVAMFSTPAMARKCPSSIDPSSPSCWTTQGGLGYWVDSYYYDNAGNYIDTGWWVIYYGGSNGAEGGGKFSPAQNCAKDGDPSDCTEVAFLMSGNHAPPGGDCDQTAWDPECLIDVLDWECNKGHWNDFDKSCDMKVDTSGVPGISENVVGSIETVDNATKKNFKFDNAIDWAVDCQFQNGACDKVAYDFKGLTCLSWYGFDWLGPYDPDNPDTTGWQACVGTRDINDQCIAVTLEDGTTIGPYGSAEAVLMSCADPTLIDTWEPGTEVIFGPDECTILDTPEGLCKEAMDAAWPNG